MRIFPGKKLVLQDWIQLWTRIQWGTSLLIFFTAGWWWRPRWIFKWPGWLVDERLFFLRYGFFPLLVLALVAWALTGFRGLRELSASGNLLWATALVFFGIWARVSYGSDTLKPDVALSAASQLAAVVAFTLSLLCSAPPKQWVITALVAGMVFLAAVGIGQAAVQGNINIRRIDDELGVGLYIRELTLNPQRSGVSVVQSEGVRFLRPYGLTAHPNLLAGVLVLGLCASFAGWLRGRAFAVGLLAFGLWGLLLTFSRAALGGLAIGVVVIFVLGRVRPAWQVITRTALLFALVILIFGLLYAPLLGVRSGFSDEGGRRSVEGMSTAARQVYIEQAWELLKTHQWRGVGIGVFPWESAYLLVNDWRDLTGDNVHNIYLLVLVETGIIGFILYLEAIIGGTLLILGRAWRRQLSLESVCLFAGTAAWLAIGWFDHYPVTQMGYQILFWGSFAVALHQPREENFATAPH